MDILFALQQTAVDSLATEVGTTVATQVTGLVVAGLGVVTAFLTGLSKKIGGVVASAPDWSKAVIALAFAQLATFGSAQLGYTISPDLDALGTSLSGLAVWGAGMGWHALLKVVTPTKAPTE